MNERLTFIEEKIDDNKICELKEIIGSQEIIDEIVVKHSDDIALIKKTEQENKDLIKSLEVKINLLGQEIQKRCIEIEDNDGGGGL